MEVAMPQKMLIPEEDLFHKYPVLKIPTGKRNELLIIGREKAEAIIKHYPHILAFHEKHRGGADGREELSGNSAPGHPAESRESA